ncbi:MAG: chemotaxis protein CheW [Spirochaetaceae bacterium]|nr:MAG: chemotaxis protein CheW [Spirochaetaceae bacterium]
MSDTAIQNKVQLLTFTLEDEQYGVEVHRVREVLEYTRITKVPRTLDFMRGVINLRGSVVPVVDLRLKFDMDETPKTIDTSIVVMEIEVNGEPVVLGALADSVQEVIDLDSTTIEAAPQIGTSINNRFIKGIGKQDETFIIILDIDRVFTEEDMNALAGEQVKAEKSKPVNTEDGEG